MSTPEPDASDRELRSWLLRRLPEARAQELEARLLADDDLAERLRDEEYALLDDYARRRLTPADRAAVEACLLATPSDRRRLHLAQALARAARRGKRRNRRRDVWAAALAAGAALATVLLWPMPAHKRSGQGQAVLADAPVIRLTANVERGARPLRIVAPRAERVRLQAEIEAPRAGARYILAITDAAGRERFFARLWPRQAGVHAYVEAALPAAVLVPGRLQVSLRAQDETAEPFVWTLEVVAARP